MRYNRCDITNLCKKRIVQNRKIAYFSGKQISSHISVFHRINIRARSIRWRIHIYSNCCKPILCPGEAVASVVINLAAKVEANNTRKGLAGALFDPTLTAILKPQIKDKFAICILITPRSSYSVTSNKDQIPSGLFIFNLWFILIPQRSRRLSPTSSFRRSATVVAAR